MSENRYVYARQIPPEIQESPLELDGGYEGVILAGNDDLNDHNKEMLDIIRDLANDMFPDMLYPDAKPEDLAKWFKEEFNEYDEDIEFGYGEKSLKEFLDDHYTTEKHSEWTVKDATEFAIAFMGEQNAMRNGYGTGQKSPDDYRAEMLSIYTGEEYDTRIIRGCCQRDWQTVYYPKDQYSDEAIDALEIEYFNLGSEWIIHEGNETPETPEDIEGYSIYVYDNLNVRKEIAEAEGVSPDNVFLFRGQTISRTVYCADSDNPKLDNKEKQIAERE